MRIKMSVLVDEKPFYFFRRDDGLDSGNRYTLSSAFNALKTEEMFNNHYTEVEEKTVFDLADEPLIKW